MEPELYNHLRGLQKSARELRQVGTYYYKRQIVRQIGMVEENTNNWYSVAFWD